MHNWRFGRKREVSSNKEVVGKKRLAVKERWQEKRGSRRRRGGGDGGGKPNGVVT